MSELKGQILGVILVLVLFGTISGVLTAAFGAYSRKIKDEVKETTGEDLDASITEFGTMLTY